MVAESAGRLVRLVLSPERLPDSSLKGHAQQVIEKSATNLCYSWKSNDCHINLFLTGEGGLNSLRPFFFLNHYF